MVVNVKTKTGFEKINTDIHNFRDLQFLKFKRGGKVTEWCEEYATFDTETSHIKDEIAWIYQWAFYFDSNVFTGRKPSEFINLLYELSKRYCLGVNKKIIIYVHNLSYDYQYMKMFLKKYDENIRVLATDAHSILIVDICGFRFLCSYKLSNLSLDLFSKSYSEKYVKYSGAINYDIVRYQDDSLKSIDWEYQVSDVMSQHDAIKHYLKVNGYTYAHEAPFTSTGFVRNRARKMSKADNKWRKEFLKSRLSLEQYNLLKQAFMGGMTICNYRFSGETMFHVKHLDFTSSYPARQMLDYFPEGKVENYGEIANPDEFKYLIHKYCCVFILKCKNIMLKEGVTAPYIPSSKCIWLKDELKLNGKIVLAKELHIAVTEIDYDIIKKQYDIEEESVSNMQIMKRGEMPKWLKELIMELFRNKTDLKNDDYRLYMVSKSLLNAIYGMTATSIIRESFDLDCQMLLNKERKKIEDYKELIDKYYKSRNSFLPYQFGVWTTAHARKALLEMIEAVGYENFIYCDTDSVFYIDNEKSNEKIKIMNENIKRRALEKEAVYKGNILGYATEEEYCNKFRALHAKCYALEDSEGLKVTIAGIRKKETIWKGNESEVVTNAEELGNIDNLKEGFVFSKCGGSRSLYLENEIETININDHWVETASSVIILRIEKIINDTMWTRENEILKHIIQESC